MNQRSCVWSEPLLSPVNSSHTVFALLVSAAVHGNVQKKCKDKRSINSTLPKETIAPPKKTAQTMSSNYIIQQPADFYATPTKEEREREREGEDKERIFSIYNMLFVKTHKLILFYHILLAPNSKRPSCVSTAGEPPEKCTKQPVFTEMTGIHNFNNKRNR